MALRASTLYLVMTAGLFAVWGAFLLHSSWEVRSAQSALARKSRIVRGLELTDLCLFTEASYTRHLSMADASASFQDAPLSLEHFPSGGLVGPPPHLVTGHGRRR
jgi:hypothetical protein